MKLKTIFLLLPAALFVLTAPARADKSYHVTMTRAVTAASVQLRPGDYNLVLDNSKVRFTEVQTGKKFEVNATIDDSADKKFEDTTIHSQLVEGATLITEIRLGGTKTRVVFR